jgi:hypothetical protein
MSEGDLGGRHRFVPVVRQGFRPDAKTKTGEHAYNDNTFSFVNSTSDRIQAPVQFSVELTLEAKEKRGGWDSDPTQGTPDLAQPSKAIRMYGPGDALGIDQERITRVEPEPGTSGSPPNYFPVVEFDRADLPWILSPERASEDTYDGDPYVDSDGKARIRPWIALVTVPEETATVTTDGAGGLPVLEAPTAELPPVDDVWAWAHAQVLDQRPGESVGDVMNSAPSRAVSRLLSPRNFYAGEYANDRYVSAVVPTFEPGRRAGLGRDPYPQRASSSTDSGGGGSGPESGSNGNDGDGTSNGAAVPEPNEIGMAWSRDEETVRLPVYYMWEFTVGDGDFESLAADLEPRLLSDSTVGVRTVDASRPGPSRLAGYETYTQTGALIAPSQAADLSTPGAGDVTEYDQSKQETLRTDVLNRIERIESATGTPVVGPPIYGQWPAAVESIDATGDSWWLSELNLDPKYRAAAGLGAEVVREHQQEYLTEAWTQVGDLDDVNRELRLGQFSRSVADHTFRRLTASVTDGSTIARMDRFLQFTSPMHGTVADPSAGLAATQQTLDSALSAELGDRDVPDAIYSGAFRRLTRFGGPLLRNATFDADVATPTKFATDFTDGTGDYAGLSAAALTSDLDNRVTTLGGLAGDGSNARVVPVDELVATDEPGPIVPETLASTRFPEVASGGQVPADVTFPAQRTLPLEGRLPVEDALADPAPLAQTDVPMEQLESSYRIGAWGTLPAADVTPKTVWTAPPSDERTFVVKTLDAQIQSGLDHSKAALAAVRAPDETVDRAETTRQVQAIRQNTFGTIDRALDAVLSIDPDVVTDEILTDKDEFVDGLLADHRAAVDALRPGDAGGTVGPRGPDENGPPAVAPDAPVEAEAAIQRIHDKLLTLRNGLYGVGRDDGIPLDPDRFPDESLWNGAGDGPAFGDLLGSLDPQTVIPEKVHARLEGVARDALRDADDPLSEIAWAPSIERPMARPLSDLADEYLLPGTAKVPKNTVGALATNPAFLEAYMTGLNHEFTRELIWRNFPADRRGTYFQTFWNRANNPDIPDADRPVADVDPLHEWGTNRPLGGQQQATPSVVLLLRSELLRQFPNTVIYMAKATWVDGERTPDLSQAEEYTADEADRLDAVQFPQFRGRLDPDITFLGFDLTPAEATGDPDPGANDPGWFFVIEEPVGETRFGFDAGDAGDEGSVPKGIKTAAGDSASDGDRPIDDLGDLQTAQNGSGSTDGDENGGYEPAWDGLSWWHLTGDPANGDSYVDVWKSRPGGGQDLDGVAPDESKSWRVTADQVGKWTADGALIEARPELASMRAQWGHNSAHMARIAWQRPVRVVIHADDVLSEEASEGVWTGGDGADDAAAGEQDAAGDGTDEYAGPSLGEDTQPWENLDVDGQEILDVDYDEVDVGGDETPASTTDGDTMNDSSFEGISTDTDDDESNAETESGSDTGGDR